MQALLAQARPAPVMPPMPVHVPLQPPVRQPLPVQLQAHALPQPLPQHEQQTDRPRRRSIEMGDAIDAIVSDGDFDLYDDSEGDPELDPDITPSSRLQRQQHRKPPVQAHKAFPMQHSADFALAQGPIIAASAALSPQTAATMHSVLTHIPASDTASRVDSVAPEHNDDGGDGSQPIRHKDVEGVKKSGDCDTGSSPDGNVSDDNDNVTSLPTEREDGAASGSVEGITRLAAQCCMCQGACTHVNGPVTNAVAPQPPGTPPVHLLTGQAPIAHVPVQLGACLHGLRMMMFPVCTTMPFCVTVCVQACCPRHPCHMIG